MLSSIESTWGRQAQSSLSGYPLEDYELIGGFLIKGFILKETVDSMKSRMARLVSECEPDGSVQSVFSTGSDQADRNNFLAESPDTIRVFLVEGAIDSETGRVNREIPKAELINKVGHALHVLDPVFRDNSFSPSIVSLVRGLGYHDPVVPQSMYIFKQPRIGGALPCHQDSTFMFTEPRRTCLGLWLALAWIAQGTVATSIAEPKRDGEIPSDLNATGFVPIPVKAGDLVGIHGLVDHNTTGRPRHSYQLHSVEGPEVGVYWSRYLVGKSFFKLQ